MIEMVIATTIFAVMSVAVVSVYIQTTFVSQKLRMTRHLSETAREITERIAYDVRESGISMTYSSYDDGLTENDVWMNPDYLSGGEMLTIGDEVSVKKVYFYGKKEWAILSRCKESDKNTKTVHCWLYVMPATLGPELVPEFTEAYNLVDSFIPEEEKKRVKIENMKFYISWDGETTEKKVTLVFTLALMPRIGIPVWLIADTRLHIQTTLSERYFNQ